MANSMTSTLLLILLLDIFINSSASPAQIPVKNQDLLLAMEEMQKANYFSFVMLIHMFPFDQKLTGNLTFLMPKDKVLSTTDMLQQSVKDFLLRHSIPSALLFEQLELIPSGSLIPSSLPDYMLEIFNGGRKNFSLNNVRIVSRNLCTGGSSIRCHGIDGVLNLQQHNNTSIQHSCSNSIRPSPNPNVVVSKPPTASRVPSLRDSNEAPVIAAQPTEYSSPRIADSSQSLCNGRLLNLFTFSMLLSITGVFIF